MYLATSNHHNAPTRLVRSNMDSRPPPSTKPNNFDRLVTSSCTPSCNIPAAQKICKSTSTKLSENENSTPAEKSLQPKFSRSKIHPAMRFVAFRDAKLKRYRKFLFYFLALLLVSSICALADGLWIYCGDPKTFGGRLIRSGTFANFSLYHAVIANGGAGLLLCLTVLGTTIRRPLLRYSGMVIGWGMLVLLWTVLTLVYNFGCNILYDSELEVLMLKERAKSLYPHETVVWRTSQNFFQCCGITSYTHWNFWNRGHTKNASMAKYPSSCCSKLKGHCGSGLVSADLVWTKGCLHQESNSLMATGYIALVISSMHFLFVAFTFMTLVKIYHRQRYLEVQTKEMLRYQSRQ